MSTVANEHEMLDAVREALRDGLGVDPVAPITADTRFFADLGLASIDAVVLGEELQRRVGRPLPFAEMMAELGARDERDVTLGELAAFLSRN